MLHKYTNLTAGDKVLSNSVSMVRCKDDRQTKQVMVLELSVVQAVWMPAVMQHGWILTIPIPGDFGNIFPASPRPPRGSPRIRDSGISPGNLDKFTPAP